MSDLELLPAGGTYENIKENKAGEAIRSQYQDLDLQTPENTGQYQELVKTPETSVKLVTDKPDITYENTRIEGQNRSGTKNQSEQSQYEELNTRNERKDEHDYSEVSLK